MEATQGLFSTLFSSIRPATPASFENLTMIPLLAAENRKADYLRLDEAIESDDFAAEEVSDGGVVGRIRVRNGLKRPVLIVDGDLLLGAKQNRIVNRTILVPADATVDVPVSCVERGRWGGGRRFRKRSSERLFASARAHTVREVNRSVEHGRGFRADQTGLWNRIEHRRVRRQVETTTGAMDAIYERERPSLKRFAEAFEPVPEQVGAIFAVDGEVRGMDVFDASSTYAAYLERLVRSYAIDAIDSDRPRNERPAEEAVARWLGALGSARVECVPSVALGEDARLQTAEVEGAALVVGDRVVHLCAFSDPAATANA